MRTDLVDHLESQSWLRALPRAVRSAYQFRRETGASFASLLREGRAMKEGNELTWAQVVMAANAPVMTKAALVEGRTDVGVLPTGQVVGVIESLPPVADIIDAVMARSRRRAEALERLDPVAARGTVALGDPAQQVRHPLVCHAEEMSDARDALPLGSQRHHE